MPLPGRRGFLSRERKWLMQVNTNEYLTRVIVESKLLDNLDRVQLPEISLDTEGIKVIMINEVTPQNPDDYFYSRSEQADFMKTTLPIFKNAGADVNSIDDIINLGIYITTAVKCPKSGNTVDSTLIKTHAPVLEEELKLFPNLRVIMLMGDVAKKSFNLIAKKNTKRNVIPSESTYKIRNNEYYYGNIRVFPSYIMTGKNLQIEKSKVDMIMDDVRKMLEMINR